jgi:integrase
MSTNRRERLTDALVERLPLTRSGQYAVRDTEVRGLMVVVGKTARTYTVNLQIMELGRSKDVRKAIGRVGDIKTREARDLALKLIGELRTGTTKPNGRGHGVTLGEAWADYRDTHLTKPGRERSAGTIANYRDHMERVLKDWLDAPLAELAERPQIVRDRHREITLKNGPYIANGCMRSLRAIYNWARKKIDRTLPPDPPVDSSDFNNEERRDTGMSPSDLAGWYAQLQRLPNAVRREFHLFSLLSGSRPSALKRARWEHLDVGKRALHFPDPKGGARKAFDMPLSREMLRCLWRVRRAGRRLHERQAQTFIFPADTESGHIAVHREDRGDLGKFAGDLRQTYANVAQAVGVPLFFTKVLLNHSQGGDVTLGYVTVDALRAQVLEQQQKISSYMMSQLVKQPNIMPKAA